MTSSSYCLGNSGTYDENMIVYPVIICFLLGNYAKESSAKFSREVIEDNNDGLEGNESALKEGNLSFGKKNDILAHLKIYI